jgi:TP901-1 family phage major tail protein
VAPDLLRWRGEEFPDRHPDFGTVAGAFQVTSLEFAGEHDGEVTTELALESAGELTFTAA